MPATGPVAIAGVPPLRAPLALAGVAVGPNLGTHQDFSQGLHHLAQPIAICLEFLAQQASNVQAWVDLCVTSARRSANSLVEDDPVVLLPEVHHPSYTIPLDTNDRV